jgi:hypothetical protein
MDIHKGVSFLTEAVNISETSTDFYQTTRRNMPEDSHLHTRRRKDVKYHVHSRLKFTTRHLHQPAPEGCTSFKMTGGSGIDHLALYFPYKRNSRGVCFRRKTAGVQEVKR